MRWVTAVDGVRKIGRRAGYWLHSVGRSLPDAVYYRLAGMNYRYCGVATEKRVRHGSFRSYELYNRHGNDWLLAALLDRCRDGEVVVDVGANTGVYALSVACEYPDATVVAIEPDPTTVERLRANIATNEGRTRTPVLAIGCGSTDGSVPFYRSSYHELSSFNRYNAERWGSRVVGCETVPIRRLDSLVADGTIPPPDHLKIDTEGFGLAVLDGAREILETHRPIIYIEPHARTAGESADHGETATGMRDLIGEANYAIIPGENGWVCVPEGDRE